jgi:hypothetical protein
MSNGQGRYQNQYLPNGGNPADTNIAIASFRYAGAIGTFFSYKQKDADGVYRRKVYMLVKTNATLATAPEDGGVAWWSDQDTFEVTTLATNRGRVAGVFVNVASVSSVCFIQILGRHPGVRFVGAPTAAPSAAGLIVVPSATAGQADAFPAVPGAGFPVYLPELGLTVGTATGNYAPVYLTIGAKWMA